MKKNKRQLRLGATLTLSALILGSQMTFSPLKTQATEIKTSQIKQNIETSPKPVKVRILGATIFSFSILTAIIVISNEIRSSRPQKEKILSKYYRT